MATAAKKTTTSSKTTATAAAPKAAAKRATKATPPTVVAKGKRGFAALAEGVPGLRSAAPATKPAAKRSAAAKRAEPTGVKKAAADKRDTLAKNNDLPQHEVKNLKGLRAIMDQYPKATHYSTDLKFGHSVVNLLNLRGRKLAEVKLVK